MKTVRLTAAQATVKFLAAQMTVVDDKKVPMFAGVFAIFGHGNVAALGEALRQKVDEHEFVFQSDSIRATISIGVAVLQEGDRTASDLLKRADERLYAAKNGGRNRVCS